MSRTLNFSSKDPKTIIRAFGGVAAAILVAGGGIVFLLNGKIQAMQVKYAAIESQVGNSETVAKKLQVTQASYALACQQVSGLDTSVPQNDYVPTLLQQLQTLSAKTGLSVTSIQPSALVTPPPPSTTTSNGPGKTAATAPPPPYDTMAINLSIVGSYAQTQQFIYGLTQFPKILSVVSVQMSPRASTTHGGPPLVSSSLHLVAYIFPTTTVTTTATATLAAPKSASAPTTAAATVVPPPAPPTLAGAIGRAKQGAVSAQKADDAQATRAVQAL